MTRSSNHSTTRDLNGLKWCGTRSPTWGSRFANLLELQDERLQRPAAHLAFGRDIMAHKVKGPTNQRFRQSLLTAASHICRGGEQGLWQDARTSATAILGLSISGIFHTTPDFRDFCLEELFESDQYLEDDIGICFNREVWDTSVGLLAIHAAGRRGNADKIAALRNWLLKTFTVDNVNHEPWETLWALRSLLQTGTKHSSHVNSQLCSQSLKWLLDCRSAEGVLIGPHYTGLLLQVVAPLIARSSRIHLDASTRNECAEAADSGFMYLRRWFERSPNKPSLTDIEPWFLGHILSGISSFPPATRSFLDWRAFNEKLV